MKAAWVGACIALLVPVSALGVDCKDIEFPRDGSPPPSCSMPFRGMPSGNDGGGGVSGTDWGEVADTVGDIIGTISEMAEDRQREEVARQPTELSAEEKLKEIEALKEKFRREAEREVANKNWWTDEDTREVERGMAQGIVDHAAKVQLASFIKDTFGSGAQQTGNLSDTAAELLLNLKTGVNGAVNRVGDVKASLKKDFNNWLDQLTNDIDKVD
ncbi:hypothetical protein O9X98_14810 [Agrobacterium salinitolerans]|nr:hypothetical protein [Agrobacterium salinitolerans]